MRPVAVAQQSMSASAVVSAAFDHERYQIHVGKLIDQYLRKLTSRRRSDTAVGQRIFRTKDVYSQGPYSACAVWCAGTLRSPIVISIGCA